MAHCGLDAIACLLNKEKATNNSVASELSENEEDVPDFEILDSPKSPEPDEGILDLPDKKDSKTEKKKTDNLEDKDISNLKIEDLEGVPITKIVTALERSMAQTVGPNPDYEDWDLDKEALPMMEIIRRENEINNFWRNRDTDQETLRYNHVKDYAALQRLHALVLQFRQEKGFFTDRLAEECEAVLVVKKPNVREVINELLNKHMVNPELASQPVQSRRETKQVSPDNKGSDSGNPQPSTSSKSEDEVPSDWDSEGDSDNDVRAKHPTPPVTKTVPELSLNFTCLASKPDHGKGRGKNRMKHGVEKIVNYKIEQAKADLKKAAPKLIDLPHISASLMRMRFNLKRPILVHPIAGPPPDSFIADYVQNQVKPEHCSTPVDDEMNRLFIPYYSLKFHTVAIFTVVRITSPIHNKGLVQPYQDMKTYVIVNHAQADLHPPNMSHPCDSECRRPRMLSFSTPHDTKKIIEVAKQYGREVVTLGQFRITNRTPLLMVYVGRFVYRIDGSYATDVGQEKTDTKPGGSLRFQPTYKNTQHTVVFSKPRDPDQNRRPQTKAARVHMATATKARGRGLRR